MSVLYEIGEDENQGRYLKARENIPEGNIIIRETPLVIGPQNCETKICFGCNKILNSVKISVCSRCKTASVCRVDCNGIWHTPEECKFLSDSLIQCGHILLNSQLILPLRCLILRKMFPQKWKELLQLESHLEKRRNTQIWKNVATSIEKLFLDLCLISEEDVKDELIQKLSGIFDVNTFEIRTKEMSENDGFDGVLQGLYLQASLINHDCIGNTHLAMDDDYTLTIRASSKISKGSSIVFNYSNPLKGTHERRLLLKETKHFDCLCSRCLDSSELGTEISSLKCPRCKKGFVRPCKIERPCSWVCSSCKMVFLHSLIHNTVIQGRIQLNLLNPMDVFETEKLLRKFSKTFSSNHYIMLEIKQNLVGLYTQSEPSVKKLNRKIQLCEELLQVFQKIDTGISRMQGITLYELHSATVMLAKKNLKSREISEKQYLIILKNAEEILKKAVKHLIYEPKHSPEGRLCLECFRELKDIKNLIIQNQILVDAKKNENPKHKRKQTK